MWLEKGKGNRQKIPPIFFDLPDPVAHTVTLRFVLRLLWKQQMPALQPSVR